VGHFVKTAMEDNMRDMMQRLDEVVRMLREARRSRPLGCSPPRTDPIPVDGEDRWMEGSRESESHRSPLHLCSELHVHRSRDRNDRGSPHHGDGYFSGSRGPPPYRDYPPPRRRDRDRKMKLPLFMGEEVLDWLVRIERYFRINEIEGEENMEVMSVVLEGKVLHWFNGWQELVPYASWRQFREAILKRFQPGISKNPYGSLLSIRQKGTVVEYVKEFEKLSGSISHLDLDILMGIFINGLIGPIKAEIKGLELGSLAAIKDRAMVLEERNLEWKKSGMGPMDRGGFRDRLPLFTVGESLHLEDS